MPVFSSKGQYVQDIFNNIATRYDLMNTMMSFGIHHYWRKTAINLANIPPDGKILDACCGTGLIIMDLARRVGPDGLIVGLDFSTAMLNIAKARLKNVKSNGKIQLIQADTNAMPFPDNTFDCVTIGYGLRNSADPGRVLKEIKRVLKPGGRALSLEMVKPSFPIFKEAYECYLKFWVPLLGQILVHNKDAYKYFYDSIISFFRRNELSDIYQELGFENIQYSELTWGIAVIHTAIKPPAKNNLFF
jgi:demethylmenaquinone methyltransferase/2-methoxy-6-polyprenyl-1,4-benzoquinol methylase